MLGDLKLFERVVRNAHRFAEERPAAAEHHPFDARDIHPVLPAVVRQLFDDSHYSQSTFEALKFLDTEVRRISGISKSGRQLMMDAFRDVSPTIQLTGMMSDSEKDEQEGYRFLFAGVMIAVRNPRGHEHSVHDPLGTCLDHLTIVSHLLRRLEQAGYVVGAA